MCDDISQKAQVFRLIGMPCTLQSCTMLKGCVLACPLAWDRLGACNVLQRHVKYYNDCVFWSSEGDVGYEVWFEELNKSCCKCK